MINPFNKKNISLDAYDTDGNLIGNFDGEFVYHIQNGSMLPFRIDGDEIYTTDPNKSAVLIGRFSDGVASLSNGKILFKCE